MRLSLLHIVLAAALSFSASAAADPALGDGPAASPPARILSAPQASAAVAVSVDPSRVQKEALCRRAWQEARSVCDAGSGRCTMNAGVQYGACLKRGA